MQEGLTLNTINSQIDDLETQPDPDYRARDVEASERSIAVELRDVGWILPGGFDLNEITDLGIMLNLLSRRHVSFS